MLEKYKKFSQGLFPLYFFLIALVLCVFAFFTSSISTSPALPVSKGDITVYFCHVSDCNKIFIDALSQSSSASCAFFDVNNPGLEKVLLEKNVHLVFDEVSKHKVKTSSVFVREGNGLMHNKFCIINNSLVITGSYNPTSLFSSSADFNTVIVIDSTILASLYYNAYNQLSKNKKKESPFTSFLHNDFLIELYFCPQDNCQSHLLQVLRSANESIYFALFTFTDKEVSSVLSRSAEKGVHVSGIVESYQSKKYNQYFFLEEAGLDVFLETSSRLQHTKLFVIDEKILVIGSYNPTIAATTINDENMLVLHNDELALLYLSFIKEIISFSSSS